MNDKVCLDFDNPLIPKIAFNLSRPLVVYQWGADTTLSVIW